MLTQLHGGIRCSRLVRAGIFCGVTVIWALAAEAQEGTEDLVDISYIHAAVLGTGTYSIRNRRITMLKVPFAWNQRPATSDSVGWRWLAPTVLGYDDLGGIDSDIIESLLPDRLVTLSVMPGVEFIYPVNEIWYLKPFVEIGGGRDFSAEETFALTQLGVRSLHVWDDWDDWALHLGLAVRWAGEYQFDSKDENGFGILDVGLDVRRGLPWRLFDQRLDLGAYYVYQRYLPTWTFGEAEDWRGRAEELHEIGLSLGVPHGRKIFGIPVKRVRVGYKRGGKVRGLTFGTEFPF